MLSTKITTAVAEREGVDPLQLDEPLYDVIDVSALESMVESAGDRDGSAFEVSFTYHGYDVTIDAAGDVHVARGARDGQSDRTTNTSATGR